jgi:hypothetical protein
MRYNEIYRLDQNNVGDMFSNPLRYFDPAAEKSTIDIDRPGEYEWYEDAPVIVGGGGLIGNEHFGNNLLGCLESPDVVALDRMMEHSWLLSHKVNKEVFEKFRDTVDEAYRVARKNIIHSTGPKIAWGIGHNVKDQHSHFRWPKWLKRFDLVGCRDYQQTDHRWVPCASCMHPAFDKKYEVTNEVIWFEHKKQLIKSTDFGEDPIPRFTNSGQNFDQTIEILGSAETILTNSYHGAYWGTLLNKKVVIVNPWSSKFHLFKHQPVVWSNKKDGPIEEMAVDAPRFPDALSECRTANKQFWSKVKETIGS